MRHSSAELGFIVTDAMRAAYRDHIGRGEAGKAKTTRNAYGDLTLVADYEAEEIVIRSLQDAGLNLRVCSEEHGQFDMSPAPDYTLVVDGLDGSSVFAEASAEQIHSGQARYGTMCSLSKGPDPRYQDNLVAAIMEPATHRLVVAVRDEGANVFSLDGGGKKIAATAATRILKGGLLYCDDYSALNQSVFAVPLRQHGFETISAGSAARYYLDVAIGDALASLEWTRKGNLEPMAAYLIVTEAGGCMVDLEGNDLGGERFLEWGQSSVEHFIAAANGQLATEIRRLIGAM